MSKRSSARKFALLGFLTLIGILLTIFSFPIPFTNYNFNGFAPSIKLGLDLSGGISAVYEASLPEGSNSTNLEQSVNATIKRLQTLLYDKGYSEALVTNQGSDRIRIEVPDVDDPSEIFNLIGDPAELFIRKVDTTAAADNVLTGKDIKNVYASAQRNSSGGYDYGVVLEFTSDASTIFYNLTSEVSSAGGSLYIYLGENKFSTLSVEAAISGGSTFISGGSIYDATSAEEFAMRIMSGTFDVNLKLLENNVISATLGADALFWSVIAGAIALVLVMAFMFWRYGELGLLANFALVIYIVLLMFFLQAIPFVQLTLPGIAGIILGLGFAVDANIIIFERMKDEYASGKKIPMAAKAGFKRALAPILDSNITTILAAIVLWILGTASVKGFAVTLLLGVVISMFTALVVTRILVKWYLPFNSTNAKKLRFKREVNVNEIG